MTGSYAVRDMDGESPMYVVALCLWSDIVPARSEGPGELEVVQGERQSGSGKRLMSNIDAPRSQPMLDPLMYCIPPSRATVERYRLGSSASSAAHPDLLRSDVICSRIEPY